MKYDQSCASRLAKSIAYRRPASEHFEQSTGTRIFLIRSRGTRLLFDDEFFILFGF